MKRIGIFCWLLVLVIMVASVWGCAGDDDDDDHENGDDDTSGDDDDDTDDPTPPSLEFDPTQMGPFPIGNITREFQDRSRWDPSTQSIRRLLVEIWYPALPAGDEVPTQMVADFMNGWDEFIIGLLKYLTDPADHENFYQTVISKRGILPDRESAPYPVVFLSHGNGGLRFQNWTLAEYLASHGYVVVAPDHTGNAVFVTFDDKLVIMNPLLMINSFFDRYIDMIFLLDQMEALTEEDPEGWLTGLIDTSRVGIVGHSFGGATVGEVLRQDARFGAGVNMNGPAMPWGSPTYDAAAFHMYGKEDHTMEDTKFFMDWAWETTPPPKYRMDMEDAGHYTLTDACLLIPSLMGNGDGCGMGQRLDGGEEFEFIDYVLAQQILDSYVTAFLGANLSGYKSHEAFLYENHFTEYMDYTLELPE